MLMTFVEASMGAEADALCGAPYGAQPMSWPATRLDRAGVLTVLSAAPFATDDPASARRRRVATELLAVRDPPPGTASPWSHPHCCPGRTV